MLEIRDLVVRIGSHEIVSIDGLDLVAGRRLGLVGESGSGKTMTAMSIVGLHPPVAHVTGSITLDGRQLVGLTDRELAGVRGAQIGVIFQDPMQALNPMMRVGKQVAEAIRIHENLPRQQVRERVRDLFEKVQLSDSDRLMRRYPHQLSGGQSQRVAIAMAIASRPRLLIADEPTTALDVTVQQGILELIVKLSADDDMGLLFVSHDLGVVHAVTDFVAVMYGGRVMEIGPTAQVVRHPRHRYTAALVAANPGRLDSTSVESMLGQPLNAIEGVVPPLGAFPSGCRFRDRCHHETNECAEEPPATMAEADHRFKCWNPAASEKVNVQ